MSNIITIEKINEIKFYQMPKAFFHNPEYIEMKNESKIAYSILRDLLSLSIENNWVNENNEVYVKLSREKMMKRLNIKGTAKYAEIIKELEQKGLIVKRRVGLRQVDETYICLPDELSTIYSDKELLELENNQTSVTFENQTSRSSKIKRQEVRKSNVKKFENQTHINTNNTNTNIINTNINTSSSKELKEEFESNICELKKTTLPKFKKVIKNNNKDMIMAVISECAITSVRSYKGFEVALNSYIKRGCSTAEDVVKAAEQYRYSKKSNIVKNNKKSASGFNNFTPREYDYDKLEKKLLGWDEE